jgi:hypothetical protein
MTAQILVRKAGYCEHDMTHAIETQEERRTCLKSSDNTTDVVT